MFLYGIFSIENVQIEHSKIYWTVFQTQFRFGTPICCVLQDGKAGVLVFDKRCRASFVMFTPTPAGRATRENMAKTYRYMEHQQAMDDAEPEKREAGMQDTRCPTESSSAE